jgi:hypothetical protein
VTTKDLRQFLEQIRKADSEATKGPWNYDCGNGQIEADKFRQPIADRCNTWDIDTCGKLGKSIPEAEENMEFIALSRTALPQAASIIEALTEALERVIGMCDVSPTCACGRPNGLPAVISCANTSLQKANALARGEK